MPREDVGDVLESDRVGTGKWVWRGKVRVGCRVGGLRVVGFWVGVGMTGMREEELVAGGDDVAGAKRRTRGRKDVLGVGG